MLSHLTEHLVEAYPADAARILEDATPEVVAETIRALPAPAATAVLRAMAPHAAAAGLACLDTDSAAARVEALPLEVAAALLLRLDAEARTALFRALPRRTTVPLRMVLRFPTGSVGSLIDPQVVTVRAKTRVSEAIEIARRAPALLRKYLFVLDDDQRLTGTVDARQCLLQAPSMPVGRLKDAEPAPLRARASLREASRNPVWERFSVVPVVDHRGVFLGVVRRASMRRAMADSAATAPEAELSSLAVDLADLCWSTAASLLVGAPAREKHRD